MDPYFQGKRIIVTGAGKGIGRQLCLTLAQLGAKVIAISRTADDLDKLQQKEPSIEVHVQDISDWSSTRTLIENIGLVDMLVNNAGLSILKPYLECTEEDFDQIFNTNVRAAFNISRTVVKCMVENKKCGAIVNLSSVCGINAVKGLGLYCCTKAAVDMMTKTMALEFGPHQIRVNSVNPTLVKTDMTKETWSNPTRSDALLKRIPYGSFAEETDVVNAIVFLLSDKASFINGTLMPIDGGHLLNYFF